MPWSLILAWLIGFACGGLAGRIMAMSLAKKYRQEQRTNLKLAAKVGELETLREHEAHG